MATGLPAPGYWPCVRRSDNSGVQSQQVVDHPFGELCEDCLAALGGFQTWLRGMVGKVADG
jgi:hypothetical protein